MKRNDIFEEWNQKHVVVDDGVAYRTDETVEQLYYEWRRRGASAHAYVSIEGVSTLVVVYNEAPELEV